MNGDNIGARTLAVLFAFTLVVHGLWHGLTDPPPGFVDNDGYFRVLRVEALWHGGDWFDRLIARVNEPYGEYSHWSRPLDVLILLLALPMMPLLGAKAAIFWGGAFSGPLLHAAAVATCAWGARFLVGRTGAVLAALGVATHPSVITYGALNRADHHIAYIFLATLGLGFALRALATPQSAGSMRAAFAAGLAAAAGIWIGIEALIFAALLLIGFGLPWLAGREPTDAPRGRRFAAGLTLGLAVGLAIERGPRFFSVEYDQISIVYLTLAAFGSVFFLAVRLLTARGWLSSPIARAACASVGAALAGGIGFQLFPGVAVGPLADYVPEHVKAFIGYLIELSPGYTPDRFPITLGVTVLAAPGLAWQLWRERSGDRFWGWMLVAICIVSFGVLTAIWNRWAIYAGLFPWLVLGDMMARTTARAAARVPWPFIRNAGIVSMVALVFLASPLTSYAVNSLWAAPSTRTESASAADCSIEVLTRTLNRAPWSDRPRVILSGINYVGDILYRTPHRIVGMSYRTEKYWRDVPEAFAARDDAVVREILDRRDVELIAICPGGREEGFGEHVRRAGGFYDRLRSDAPPDWVRRIATPQTSAWRVFEVLR